MRVYLVPETSELKWYERIAHQISELRLVMAIRAKHLWQDHITMRFNARRHDGQPIIFAFIFCVALTLLVFLHAADVRSHIVEEDSATAQARAQLNLINFADFILDLPDDNLGDNPDGRYQETVKNLVLENPEVITHLKVKDLTYLFTSVELTKRIGESYMWQFASESCVLDVFFVNEDEDNFAQSEIEYFDIRSRTDESLVQIYSEKGRKLSNKEAMSKCLTTIVQSPDGKGKTVSLELASLEGRG